MNIKELQKYTRNNMDKYFKNPDLQEWSGDPVKLAFHTTGFGSHTFTVFDTDNWSDRRIHLFRTWFYPEGIHNDIAFTKNLAIVHMWNDDRNHVFIYNSVNNDVYYSTWYKDRGRTDLITKNGALITLKEFEELLEEMVKPANRMVE